MDIEELDELIKLHGRAIYGFCSKLTRNKADTDDLYQETFLTAMEVLHKLDVNHNPRGFLISIAIRLRNNNRRKFAWRQRIAPTAELNEDVHKICKSEGEATPEEVVLSRELRDVIQAAADKLNDKLKIPLYMYYTAEMSVDEIASTLNIPSGTVKSRLHQARKSMKQILEVESYE
ncbi:sigma-70 family RNA polymerase sigma factor [Paenibacillus filicis]|uniref:Sigma-70 family RNA polymerase sigma factor n=1 Tax=Paenibacillus filicis TaxID=669464 RepID=A0ABU9DF70_9BACL